MPNIELLKIMLYWLAKNLIISGAEALSESRKKKKAKIADAEFRMAIEMISQLHAKGASISEIKSHFDCSNPIVNSILKALEESLPHPPEAPISTTPKQTPSLSHVHSNVPPPLAVDHWDGTAFGCLHVGRKSQISFHRTLRIPEDGREYPLPASLGTLPIHRVEDYAETVPQEWLEEGGFFIPLYQREALFLQFDGEYWCPAIAKVCVGHINAITGKPISHDLSSHSQDYIVIPSQNWLDGVNAGNGLVRQFVAMPLGQGYTVEAQISDEEKHGGFQILVYEPVEGRFPSMPDYNDKMANVIISACKARFQTLLSQCHYIQRIILTEMQEENFSCAKISCYLMLNTTETEKYYLEFRNRFVKEVEDIINRYLGDDPDRLLIISSKVHSGLGSLGLRKTVDPENVLYAGRSMREDGEMGIAVGGMINQQIFADTFGVESWDVNRRRMLRIHILNSEDYQRITGRKPPPTPVTDGDYERAGIPWFSNYNESAVALMGASRLKGIIGVDDIDKRRGIRTAPLQPRPAITPEIIQRIKTPDAKESACEFRSRASACMAAGHWSMAIRSIDYLVDLGDFAEAADYAARSYCNYQLERFAEAIMDANNALEVNQGAHEVLVTRGRCRLALGDYEGLREDAEELIKYPQTEAFGLELCAEAALLAGCYNEAIVKANAFVKKMPGHQRAGQILEEARQKAYQQHNEEHRK